MKKALAVKYDPQYPAPFVLAKGQGDLAERIVRMADQYGVPVQKHSGMADGLYKIEIGELVPEEYYRALAELLVFIGWVDGGLGD